MNQLQTPAIILSRTDFGEADRILTMLTPEQGKVRLMARGVRRVKSKLAGGIELFSISQLTYLSGKGDIGTLISARLEKHYGRIVQDIDRTMLGYDLIRLINKNTEDSPESDYFDLLLLGFAALDEPGINTELIRLWFTAHLIRLGGHTPNLSTDMAGDRLTTEHSYNFDIDAMTFTPFNPARFSADHIKVLRLLFSGAQPQVIQQVRGLDELLPEVSLLVKTLAQNQLRV
ncbi:MAG: repair protein RecO [Candidatus Saccharibacteria bacterium]|nr:repair protein RecO [Candidatus Saccharibacteria bacterium]